jgi:hypothetical protein
MVNHSVAQFRNFGNSATKCGAPSRRDRLALAADQ